MARINLLLFCFLNFLNNTTAQNLIPNPSFEDTNICHKYTEPCSPSAWRPTSLKLYKYIKCTQNQINKPEGPKDGFNYISVLMFDQARDYDRKFMQTRLLCPLVKGETYELTINFRAKEFKLNSFSAYFSKELIFSNKNEALLEIEPQLVFEIPDSIDQGNWNEVKLSYTANGGETALLIGNLNSDENSTVNLLYPDLEQKKKGYFPAQRVYYDFDEIALTPLSGEVTCDLEWSKAMIYTDSFRHVLKEIVPKYISETLLNEKALIENIEKDNVVIEKEVERNQNYKLNEVMIFNDLRFKPGSAILESNYTNELIQLGQYLMDHQALKLEIRGHTDNTGDRDTNLALSIARAKAIFEFLVKYDIEPKRISFIGYGEDQPIAENNTLEGKQRNRRVEFIIK